MAAVALGLSCALAWGLADFLAGAATRRAALVSVLLVSQVAALAGSLAILAASGEPAPDAGALAQAAGAGLLMIVAIASFYRALGVGPMALVAPIMASSAVIPVVVGAATGDRLSTLQAGAIVLCLGGLLLAVRAPRRSGENPPGGGLAAVLPALTAMAAFGCFLVLFDRAASASLPWTLAASRAVALAVIVVVVAAFRQRPSPPGRRMAWVAAVGLLDVAGLVCFGLATDSGLLSVVAVVASLHPVVTGLLARVLLRERLARVQGIGIAGALVGVVALAAG